MGRNEYISYPNNIIGIVDKNGNIAYIDEEDLYKVSKYTFYKDNSGYFRAGIRKKKYIPLHNIITNNISKLVVNHINRCKLDNRRCNLEICSQQKNCYNQKLRKTNKTGYNGISYDTKRNKYCATIGKKRIGRYDTIEEAVKAREEYEECLAIT